MQFAHPKVAKQKLGTFRPQFCYGALTVQHGCLTVHWTVSEKNLYLSLPPTRQDLTQRLIIVEGKERERLGMRRGSSPAGHQPTRMLMERKVGDGRTQAEKRRSGTCRSSSPAGLCWSSSHLVQCGPDEPSWTWTQIWLQTRMPDYSLNWTARSSAI